jgi:hypothetical protein
MTVAALSLAERILIWIFIVPPFLALTLFELITGRLERQRDYYRFWKSGRGKHRIGNPADSRDVDQHGA